MHSWEGAYKGLAALSHELEVVRLGAGEREGAAAGRLLGGHFGVVTRTGGLFAIVVGLDAVAKLQPSWAPKFRTSCCTLVHSLSLSLSFV